MTSLPHALGQAGEQAARDALAAAGYGVIESNFRIPGSEIDVICRDPEGLVFVEVRARGDPGLEPSATITGPKLRSLMRGARSWLVRHGLQDADWRFVVVSVRLDEVGHPVATSILEDPFAHLPEYHRGDP